MRLFNAFRLLLIGSFASLASIAAGNEFPNFNAAVLRGTKPLETDVPVDVLMVRGINRYAEEALVEARARRDAPWLAAPADSEAGQRARKEAQTRLRKIAGVPSQFSAQPILMVSEFRSGDDMPWGEGHAFTVQACQWEAFEGVKGEALVAIPNDGVLNSTTPIITVVPDADHSPEQMFGLEPGVPASSQIARQLATHGCIVFCPLVIDRDCTWSAHPNVRQTNLPHREYLYRLSFQLGLHPVGFEVAKILTGVEAVRRHFGGSERATALYGEGEGGLLALISAAIESRCFDVVVIRGYFDQREGIWQEPAYRNLFGQLTEFGDAEIASLIAPRFLIIDTGSAPEITGPPSREGVQNICAPGKISTPKREHVLPEFNRAAEYYQRAGAADSIMHVSADTSDSSTDSTNLLLSRLQIDLQKVDGDDPQVKGSAGSLEYRRQRMRRQVEDLVEHTQKVLRLSEFVRRDVWKRVDRSGPKQFEASVDGLREKVHVEMIGQLPPMECPPNPRSRKILDEPTHVGYEIILDCYPHAPMKSCESQNTGVIAGGVLLLPRDLKPGERRPVVVFQHGLEGTPQQTVDMDPSERHFKAYQGVSTQLVKRGFIVYAPQNPYRGEDEFRVIQRKSNPLGRSLFSYIIEQHRQTLRWLAQQPYVDRDRIAFYGISYGGKTAMRVPTILLPSADEPGYCLAICSADYNDWIRKTCSAVDRYSYVYSNEYEIYEWNMAHVANYAELTWLILPRPFMVERGMNDPVAPDDWVAAEFAKARRPYIGLGIGDRAEIEFFNGPHSIHGIGTFQFLHEELSWPDRRNISEKY